VTGSELASVKEQLLAGQQALLAAIEGLSNSQAAFKPSPEACCILECMEHVAVAERKMLTMIERAEIAGAQEPSSPDWNRSYITRAADRARKFSAPSPVIPKARFATLEEARRAFLESRERTLAFVAQSPTDLYTRKMLHPIAGPIDAYRCLLLMAAHPLRHAAQIVEIRNHPEFPKWRGAVLEVRGFSVLPMLLATRHFQGYNAFSSRLGPQRTQFILEEGIWAGRIHSFILTMRNPRATLILPRPTKSSPATPVGMTGPTKN
jgi:hypothetical protein